MKFLRQLLHGVIVLALCACSGGETGTGMDLPVPDPEPPVINPGPVNKLIVGPIARFGSVVVNGVTFDATAADIRIDGKSASATQLAAGMVVKITAEIDNDGISGRAEKIELANSLKGTVQSNRLSVNKTLTVLGQTVVVNNDTVFESDSRLVRTINQLGFNAYVEVNGFSNQEGIVYANYIRYQGNGTEAMVQGKVGVVGNFTFQLGELAVVWDTNTRFQGLTAQQLSTGEAVRVLSYRGLGFDGKLRADYVEKLEEDTPVEGAGVQVQGTITAASEDYFLIGPRKFVCSTETASSNPVASLSVGTRVLVSGTMDLQGVIHADQVTEKSVSNVSLESTIDSIDHSAGRFVMLGMEIYVDEFTVYSTEYNSGFTFSDLAQGDSLEVNLVSAGSGRLTATKLKREDFSTRSSIEGEFQGVAQQQPVPIGYIKGLPLALDLSQVSAALAARDYNGKVVEVNGYYDAINNRFVVSRIGFDD